MATHRYPILGANLLPTSTGDVFIDRIENQLASTANTRNELAIVMKDPGSSAEGFYCTFQVPKNYAGSPAIVATYVLDGVLSSANLQFAFQSLNRASGETVDAAYGSAATVVDSSGADETYYEATISSLAGSFSIDDTVFYHFYRAGSSSDTYTGNALVTGLFFQYADA